MPAIFTWAVKNGEYVHVSTFPPKTGLNCGCTCPECGKPVGSRIYSESNNSSCFFHERDENNIDCNGGQGESELHLAAKKILEQNNYIILPEKTTTNKLRFNYTEVHFEKKLNDIRPDIIVKDQLGKVLLVEIAVTSFCRDNPQKIEKLQHIGVPAIEIGLKEFHKLDQTITELQEQLKSFVIDEIKGKEWVSEPSSLVYGQMTKIPTENDNSGCLALLLGVGFFVAIFSLFKKSK